MNKTPSYFPVVLGTSVVSLALLLIERLHSESAAFWFTVPFAIVGILVTVYVLNALRFIIPAQKKANETGASVLTILPLGATATLSPRKDA